MKEETKAVILSQSGFALRALGRLAEASQPMQASLELAANQKDWKAAAICAGNLSELYLTLGEVSQAVASARQSVDFADRSGDGFMKESMRTTLADALHQAGELTQAQQLFREAEAMQQQRQPEYPFLYSLQGFRFCDLLLSQGQYQEVQKRARQMIEWEKQGWMSLLDRALDKLSLGRAFLLQALAETTARALGSTKLAAGSAPGQYFDQAREYLQQAVAGLREASRQDYLPRALFARAAFHRAQNEFALASADLEEAREIAERGGMKLWLAEYHLEVCRLESKEQKANSKKQAEAHLAIAEEMIEKMGYNRRRPEVEELRRQLAE